MDIHKLKISCEHLFNSVIKMYFEGGENFKGEESKFNKIYNIAGQLYNVTVA